jgi:hypothetical protein
MALLNTITKIQIMQYARQYSRVYIIHSKRQEHYNAFGDRDLYVLFNNADKLSGSGNLMTESDDLADYGFLISTPIHDNVDQFDITFAGLWALWIQERCHEKK